MQTITNLIMDDNEKRGCLGILMIKASGVLVKMWGEFLVFDIGLF